MTRIESIWTELENDRSFSHGLLLRRYSGSIIPDVYIALKSPEQFRCLAVSVRNSITVHLGSFSNLKDICVELLKDEKRPGCNILLLKLNSNQHRDIFSVLCEDLMTSISAVNNDTQLVQELLNRFEKWKSLFDRATSQGLSLEEQRGLFGEVYFLRKFLKKNGSYLEVINSWVGPEKQIRDFQSGSWSVEVKTTHGNNHQKILVSSERQLDTSNLENLFLNHISLDSRQMSGETLNQLIESVLGLLEHDFTSLTRFKNKLLSAGYFDQNKNYYEHTGYFIRQDVTFLVKQNFPRIEEVDIRDGVGDVKYSIIVSHCSDFIRTDDHVFNTLIFI
jgi:hypothetical protein